MTPGQPEVLLSEAEVLARVDELAAQISEDYRDAGELVLLGVLKGAFIFLADLTRRLTLKHRVDFLAVSSYGSSDVSSGVVRLIMDLRTNIEGKHVLIVEDIVDSGHTLAYLTQVLSARRPASLKTCVLTRKVSASRVAVDYLGFDIPDAWVVGYGLDYADQYRTLPYIAQVDPRDVEVE